MPSNRLFAIFLIPTLSVFSILFAVESLASGSVGGGGGLNQYDQMYKQGKVIFFQKVACDRTECSIRRSELNESLARDLVASLRSKDELKLTETAADKAISSLASDEVEKVEHYLSRRFRIQLEE